jgi:hypothetical protein
MANRTGKPRSALSTGLNLAGFGLAAVASIVFCGIAAFSFLYTSEEMPQTSENRDRSAEVKLTHESLSAAAELLGSGQDSPAGPDTPPREASGAQSASEPASPGASEASATHEAALSGTASPPAIPADKADWVSRASQVQDNQLVKLDADDAALPHEEMPRPVIQPGKSNAAAWKYRLKKECGPIKDRALYDDCFRSFRAQYPTDDASLTRTYSRKGF